MSYLIWLELRRGLLQMRRYPVETTLSFLLLAAMFFGIAYGASAALGNQIPPDRALPLMLVSYIAWMMCMSLVSGSAGEFEAEAQSGTIEQIFTAGVSVARILAARMTAGAAITASIVTLIAFAFSGTTGATLGIFPLMMIAVACASAAGIGFVLAGVALVIKRTRALVMLATFGLLPVMMSNVATTPNSAADLSLLVPVIAPIGIAKAQILGNAAPALATTLVLTAAALLHLSLGLGCFNLLKRRAMRAGSIGHY